MIRNIFLILHSRQDKDKEILWNSQYLKRGKFKQDHKINDYEGEFINELDQQQLPHQGLWPHGRRKENQQPFWRVRHHRLNRRDIVLQVLGTGYQVNGRQMRMQAAQRFTD